MAIHGHTDRLCHRSHFILNYKDLAAVQKTAREPLGLPSETTALPCISPVRGKALPDARPGLFHPERRNPTLYILTVREREPTCVLARGFGS